jgi:hypothetical protein
MQIPGGVGDQHFSCHMYFITLQLKKLGKFIIVLQLPVPPRGDVVGCRRPKEEVKKDGGAKDGGGYGQHNRPDEEHDD